MTKPQDFTAFQRAIRAEQARLGNTPGKVPMEKTGPDAEARARLAKLQERIVELMRDGKPRNTAAIMAALSSRQHDVRSALVGLREDGKLSVVSGGKIGQQTVYQHLEANP